MRESRSRATGRLRSRRRPHVDDPVALEVASASQHEIDVYRRYPGAFGYVFFVVRRDENDGWATSKRGASSPEW